MAIFTRMGIQADIVSAEADKDGRLWVTANVHYSDRIVKREYELHDFRANEGFNEIISAINLAETGDANTLAFDYTVGRGYHRIIDHQEKNAMSTNQPRGEATWSPVNQAYITTFGDQLLAIRGTTIHKTYVDLVENCRDVRLMPVSIGRGRYLLRPLE